MEEKNSSDKLDELIEAAIPTIKANLTDDSDEAPDVITSKEHDEKMEEIFKLAKKMENDPEGTAKEYEKMVANYKNMHKGENEADSREEDGTIPSNMRYIGAHQKHKKFIASLIAATLIIGLIGAVGASKIDLIKVLLDDKEGYSEVNNNNYAGNEIEVGNMRFAYIPKGYKYVETMDSLTNERCLFKKDDDEVYFIVEIRKRKWGDRIDTENSQMEEITINDKTAVYMVKDGLAMISWKENDLGECVVYGNCDRNILENVAKNVKIIEDVSLNKE